MHALQGRMTLLLGPPGSGKSTLLKALAGKLNPAGLRIGGGVTYNSKKFSEFVPQRTAAYIEQVDVHIAELTCAPFTNSRPHNPRHIRAAAKKPPAPMCSAFSSVQMALGRIGQVMSVCTADEVGLMVAGGLNEWRQ